MHKGDTDPLTLEDRPLSVWTLSEDRRVGTFDAVDAGRVTHKRGEDWPVHSAPGQPIGVQLVRGAKGTEQDWALVMDGVTCGAEFKDADTDDLESVPVCELPAPFETYVQELKNTTLVRPVAITVRLEEEALEPESVHVVIQQVVYSTERSAQSSQDTSELQQLQRVQLPVHTSRDAVAPSVVLPYPFVAPPQSALGIVSYREVKKWYEKRAAVYAANAKKQKDHDKAVDTHEAQYLEYLNKRSAVRLENKDKKAEFVEARQAWQARGGGAAEPKEPTYKKQPLWTRRAPVAPIQMPELSSSEPIQERSFVIGGTSKSSAQSVAEIYQKLKDACLKVQTSGRMSLAELLHEMRAYLSVHRLNTELAFLETLLTSFVSPAADAVLERRYLIDDDGNVKPWDPKIEAKEREDNFKQRMKQLEGQVTFETDTSQFVYDYVPFQNRQNTHTRLRVVIEILEHSGERRVVAIEPRLYNGLAAHAVYSDVVGDRENLKKAGDEFLDCLLDVKKADEQSWINKLSGGWYSWLKNRFAGKTTKWKYSQLESMVNEVYCVHEQIVPLWPEPLSEEALAGFLQTLESKTGDKEIEEAAKRYAADEVGGEEEDFFALLETETQDKEWLEERVPAREAAATEDAAREAAARGTTAGTWSEAEQLSYSVDVPADTTKFEPTVTTGAPLGGEAYDEYDPQVQIRERKERNEFLAKREKIYVASLKKLGLTPEASGKIVSTNTNTLVVRELPQVARPVRNVNIALKIPVDTAPPDPSVPAENNSPDLIWRLLGWTAGWLTFAPVFKYQADLMIGVAKVTATGGLASELSSFGASLYRIFSAAAAAAAPAAAAGAAAGPAGAAGVGAAFSLFATLNAVWSATEGLSSVLGNFYVDTVVQRGYAFQNATNMGGRVASTIISWNRASNTKKSKLATAYVSALNATRGVPITASIASGRKALKLVRERARESELAIRSDAGVSVLYDVSTKKRYHFAEYFKKTQQNVDKLRALPKARRAADWAVLPDTTALLVLPPSDVIGCVYEVESLRRLPYDTAVVRTVGAPPRNVATSMPTLAAKAAYQELVGMVRAGRFPHTELSGEHLFSSAERIALVLATAGARLVEAAYGSKAGITLVDGSDPMWSCLPAGVAARVALRHMSLFSTAESNAKGLDGLSKSAEARFVSAEARFVSAEASDSEARFSSTKKYWRQPRRELMDQFARAFVSEAKAAAAPNESVPRTRTLVADAVASFERVVAISPRKGGSLEDSSGALVVASAFGVVLGSTGTGAQAQRTVDQVADAQHGARSFSYQKSLFEPQAASDNRTTAVWASRRLDIEPMRTWKPGASPKGVDSLLQALWSPEAGPACYYCPMGSGVHGLLGNTPFGVHDLSARSVWTRAIAEAASVLKNSVCVSDSAATIDAELVPQIGFGQRGVRGYARHPLTTSVDKKPSGLLTVRTQLASTPSPANQVCTLNFDTVLSAVEQLQTDPAAGVAATRQTLRMRALAYNADRLQHAVGIAVANARAPESIGVRLPHAEACVALGMALALLSSEQTHVLHNLAVYVEDDGVRERARAQLERVQRSCERALEDGCKVSTLAEACAALA